MTGRTLEDLDEHVFFAGAFVELLSTAEGGEVTGYGFCNSVDADERIATVTWYSVTGLTDPTPCLIKTEQAPLSTLLASLLSLSSGCGAVEVAEMELRPFGHFSLAPGTGVIRSQPMPLDQSDHPLRNVGQVTGYDLPTGKIKVHISSQLTTRLWEV